MITLLRAARRAAFLLAAVATAAGVSAADVRVYVQFAPGQRAAAQPALAQAQARTHHDFNDLGAVAVSLPEAARSALARNPAISLIEDDPAATTPTTAPRWPRRTSPGSPR